jgi:hypothetical protein
MPYSLWAHQTVPQPRHPCWAAIGAGYGEQSLGDVTAHWGEQATIAEGAEGFPHVGLLYRPASPPGGNRNGSAAGGACARPVPGVVNWATRLFRNTLNGVTGSVEATATSPLFGMMEPNVLSHGRKTPRNKRSTILKITCYTAGTGSKLTRYPSRSIRRVNWSTRCSRR